MARQLMYVLQRTRRYSASALARRCADIGRPRRRETISRVLNGTQPPSRALVEDLARAAGVDLAFLLVDRTDLAREVALPDVGEPVAEVELGAAAA